MKLFFSVIYIVIFSWTFVTILSAQNEPFRGGFGDGFSLDTIYMDYFGTSSGSIGDGYMSNSISTNYFEYSSGGEGDGFSTAESLNQFSIFSSGGNADGFSFDHILNDQSFAFQGGISDGFAFDKYGHIIFWTGSVGTGWNVAENWEDDIIPSHCNPVVIPSNVPNFPMVNSGLLRIGYYTDSSDYNCQSLKINSGANMLTRVNCYVENYSLIFNRGKLLVKNPDVGSFKNLGPGIVLLKPNAELVIKD